MSQLATPNWNQTDRDRLKTGLLPMDLKDEERADNGKDKSEDPGKEIGRPAPTGAK